jgi:hypothetical protein
MGNKAIRVDYSLFDPREMVVFREKKEILSFTG